MPIPGHDMVIYLHGFNSGGQSQKASWLRKHLAPEIVLAPTYEPHRADMALRTLRKFIYRLRRENPGDPRLMLVGSSLGGFWAQYLAPEFRASLVLINPSLRPFETLSRHVGRFRNPATGGESVLTEADLAAMRAYRVKPCNPGVPTLTLLDEGDEVLDYRVAATALRDCGRMLVFPGGDHRFAHLREALPAILELYRA